MQDNLLLDNTALHDDKQELLSQNDYNDGDNDNEGQRQIADADFQDSDRKKTFSFTGDRTGASSLVEHSYANASTDQAQVVAANSIQPGMMPFQPVQYAEEDISPP